MTELIAGFETGRAIAWRNGVALNHGQFLADVLRLAEELPDGRFVLNLCEDRYNFLVALVAAVGREQVSLFPNSLALGDLERILAQYRDVHVLYDGAVPPVCASKSPVSCAGKNGTAGPQFLPSVAADRTVIHAFTSGTTGIPQATKKSWQLLIAGAEHLERRVGASWARQYRIVATVPSGHSYGIETAVEPLLFSGCSVACGRPLFPADVRAALEGIPPPRCLVTTPVHLKVLTLSSVSFPAVSLLMSATAPLSLDLARQAESRFGARILEIYGSTESGYVATRWTTDGGDWVMRDDMQLHRVGEAHAVTAGFLPDAVPLADGIETQDYRTFRLVGRSSDMVNIAGKRTSLSGMNQILLQIPGVEDGVVLMPEADSAPSVNRLVAIVVAPQLSKEDIRTAFRKRVDSAFVPRQIVLVEALPRNETGKLPRERALALLTQSKRRRE
jgi:acyl-coenzyme A synthetase/AMP-(fatty) acid ligase